MAILVTGGAGFIGANFIIKCIRQLDETIVNFDKLTYAGNLDNLKSVENERKHVFIKVLVILLTKNCKITQIKETFIIKEFFYF